MKATRFPNGLCLCHAVALCLLTTLGALGTTRTWTGVVDADWHTADNWSGNTVPADGETAVIEAGDVVLLTNETATLAAFTMTGGTLTFSNWTTRLRATELVLTNNATLTLPTAFSNTQMSNRVWIVCSNFTMGANAAIDANNKGYARQNGPGCKIGNYGGSHGDIGSPGYGANWIRPLPYGSAADPVAPGSGGGNAVGGPGGGAVRIEAAGQVTLHGTISVNGGPFVTTHGAGGSGGSITILCQTLAGSETGLLSASGGTATHNGGAGAGGRIAVVYDPAEQASLVPVNPGIRFRVAPGTGGYATYAAGPGSLYFPDTLFVSGQMSDQWQGGNLQIPGFLEWRLDSLDVAGDFGLPAVTNLVVTNAMTVSGRLRLYASPTNAAAPDYGMLLDVGGALDIDGELCLAADPTNGATIRVQCDRMTLAQGGDINADYRGFAVTHGPGAGTSVAGGSHGGRGSPGLSAWATRKPPYGDPALPTWPGSGGADVVASPGGGAVRIYAADSVAVHGTISANGGTGINTHGAGGSGGSILIECKTLLGDANGLLRARGGNGTSPGHNGGAGGGGRIAVLFDPVFQAALPTPNPGVGFDVRAGVSGQHDYLAEDGTIYFPDRTFLSEQMSTQWQRGNILVPDFKTWNLDSLEIAGQFSLPTVTNLTVAGDMILREAGALTLVAASTNETLSDCGMYLKVGGRLTLETNALLRLVSDHDTGASPYLECKALTLLGESVINADYVGFAQETGNGKGSERGGAGHGGVGASGTGGTPGTTYDSEQAPLLPGSGGGNGNDGGGRGGGAVRIGVHGSARLDGTVQARGMYRKLYHGGGGAGGTVLISAGRFSGGGTILANGGNTSNHGGAGGGGRIAVWTPFLPLSYIRDMATHGLPRGAVIVDPAQAYPDLLLSVDPGIGGTAATQVAESGSLFFARLVPGTLLLIR